MHTFRFKATAVATLALVMGFAQPQTTLANGLAATVNGRPIAKSEIEQLIFRQLKLIDTQAPPAQRAELKTKLRTEALETLIEVELILSEFYKLSQTQNIKQEYVDEEVRQDIRNEHGGSEQKFLAELKTQGISLKKYRDMKEKMLIVGMMRQSKTKDSGYASPDRKAEFLKQNAEQFRDKDKFTVRTITLPKMTNDPLVTPQSQKQLINEIRSRVMNGGDFSSEAKTYSQDARASDGGGPIGEEYLSKQLLEVVSRLNAKSVSTVVEDQDNFYLLYVEDKILGKSRPKAEIDAEVEKMVIMEQRKKSYEDWVDRLKKKANIRKF